LRSSFPSLLVLGSNQTLARGAELGDEPHVAEHEPRLRREIANELVFCRVHGIRWRHLNGEGSQELSLVADLDRVLSLDRGEGVLLDRERHRVGCASGHRDRPELGADPEPDARGRRAGPVAEDLRHPREHILRRVRFAHPFRELAQHLVGGRPPAVDEPVGQASRAGTHRLERDGKKGGGHERKQGIALRADDRSDAAHDERVDGGHECGEQGEDHGLLDDHIEVVQAIPEDSDAAGDRDPDDQRRERQREQHVRDHLVPVAQHDPDEEEDEERGTHVQEPADLLTGIGIRATEPDEDGDAGRHGREERRQSGDDGQRLDQVSHGGDTDRIRHVHLRQIREGSRKPPRCEREADHRHDRRTDRDDEDPPPPRGGQLAVGEEQEDRHEQ
jgi:hypothetical protein